MAASSINNDELLAVILTGNSLFNNSSSDEDDFYCGKSRKVVPKVVNYAEVMVPMFDDEFKSHFRMLRSTFEMLLEKVGPQITYSFTTGCPPVEPRKQLLVAIWLLANQESFRLSIVLRC